MSIRYLLSPPSCTSQATVDHIIPGRKHLYNFLDVGWRYSRRQPLANDAIRLADIGISRRCGTISPPSAETNARDCTRNHALGYPCGSPMGPNRDRAGPIHHHPYLEEPLDTSFTILSCGLVLTLYTIVFWAVEIRASGSRRNGNGRPRSGIGSAIAAQSGPTFTASVKTTVTTMTMVAASEDEGAVWSWLLKRLSKITTPSSTPNPEQAAATSRGAATATSVLADIFVGIGRNPLALYLLSEILMLTMSRITVHLGDGDEEGGKLDVLLYSYGFASWIAQLFSSGIASLCWSLVWVVFVIFPISFLMHRCKG
ncbi:hypothetical protein BJ742DRAFT_779346 [Cladochytrium replicatum]|nr:hypothetical protein BJ742DRAFT_779346 [Cladochytrium replicatum]